MAINLGISYTTKEKQEFEHTTLEKLKEGYSLSEIGDMIGISRWTVKEIKDKLVSDKKITEEEMAKRVEKKEENSKPKEVTQDNLKSKKKKPSGDGVG